MRIYRGEYVDIETNLANENIQVTKRIDILDGNSNPFNIVVSQETVGPNIEFTFTFDTLPANATGTSIGYSSDGGVNWSSNTGGVTSPRTITLPFADYEFTFTVQTPTGNIYWTSEEEITTLEMTDNPVRDIVIDNAEDKFTPIRARQLNIQIYSSNDVSINNFSQGGDDSFRVNYYIDDVLNFVGFLSLADISQEFMPDPNVINLVAVDGLGFLNDIPLTDFDGNNPENEYDILSFICWALSKIETNLNIKSTFNIREVTAQDLNNDNTGNGHFFKWNYLDAKTFEDEVGSCINCYEVLVRILGEEATLFQDWGVWRIVRVDEVEIGLPTNTVYEWSYLGNFIGKFTETNSKNIGVGQTYSWMNDDPVMSNDRLIKESRLTFKYETPEEIPCNVDFERGAVIDDSDPNEKTYDLDCWEKLWSNTSSDDPQTTGIYVKRIFVNDYETERYLVLDADAARFTFVMSSKIYMSAKDKFIIGVARRLSSDVAGSGPYRDADVQVRLYGNDGTYWTHHARNTGATDPTLRYWIQCTATFRTNQRYFYHEGDAADETTESVSLYDGESAELPVDGYIRILVYRSSLYGATKDTYIDSVTFDYLAWVNGSYRKYTGQQQLVMQDVATRNVREKQVYISDSPKKLFKGALLIAGDLVPYYTGSATFINGNSFSLPGYWNLPIGTLIVITGSSSNNITSRVTDCDYSLVGNVTAIAVDADTVNESAAEITISIYLYPLAGLFYNAAQEPDGPEFPKPFGEIQSFDVWNQFNRTMVTFDGTVDHSNPAPSMLNRYVMADPHLNTIGRIFLLLHYEYDSHLCEWTAYFAECSNEYVDKQYTGNSFKYLTK